MARDEEKKTNRGRKTTEETEQPKKGARSRSTSAKTAAKPTTAKSAAKGATKPPARKAEPTMPPEGARSTTARRKRTEQTEPTERDYREPAHDDIARRAYERWRETGNEDALHNWIEAEKELRAREYERNHKSRKK